jgi:hypothetical protein
VFVGSSILIRVVYRVIVRLLIVEVKVILKIEIANPRLGYKASFNIIKRNRFARSRARVSYNSYNYNRKSYNRRSVSSLVVRGRA